MACEVRAVDAAAAALAARLDATGLDPSAADFEIAAAKLRANRAVGVVTAIAHQVHGAIGFTEEYDLHRVTVPLMRWRSEQDRKSTRRPPVTNAHLVCRLLLEKKNISKPKRTLLHLLT